MNVYDPTQGRLVALAALETASTVAGVIPVRAEGGDWFAIDIWLNHPVRLERLDAERYEAVCDSIEQKQIHEELQILCREAVEEGRTLALDEADGKHALRRALAAIDCPVRPETVVRLRTQFSEGVIAQAILLRNDPQTLADPFEGVEVVSVSRLIEEMRARSG